VAERKKLTPAQIAARKSRSAIGSVRNQVDQQKYLDGLPANVRKAYEKGRYDFAEVLDTFGSDIDKDIDARGAGYNIDQTGPYKAGDDALAIYPEEDPAYNPASFDNEDFTEVPTQTSMIDRPRTVAASYSPERSVLTLVFRDSTIYNYYDVSIDEWRDFKRLSSKWAYISDHLNFKPRGPANTSDLPPKLRYLAYRGARALQIKKNT
jgi:hypothetical protein